MRPLLALVSLAVLALVPTAGRSQSPEDRAATLKYLQTLHAPDGGYYAAVPPPGSQPEPSVSATNAALRAIKYLGGEMRDSDKDKKFVARCYDANSGGFGDRPGEKPTVATTIVGVMAAAELKMPLDPYREGVTRFVGTNAKGFEDIRLGAALAETLGTRLSQADTWLAEVNKSRKADGTFGDGDGAARATGGTVALILRLGGKIENREAVLNAMKKGQRSDGGWGPADKPGSDLPSTYRVMRSFMMLKEQPADPIKLRTFIATCRNKDGGYGVSPGQPSTASGTYYAAIVLHWLEAR